MKHWPLFLAIVAVVAAATWFDLSPQFPVNQGLDLRGGMRMVLEINRQAVAEMPPDKRPDLRDPALASRIRQILTERVNAFGISGADVRSRGSDQFIIEIPATQPKVTNDSERTFFIVPGENVIGSGKDAKIPASGKDVPAKAATIAYKGDSAEVKAESDKVLVNREPLKKGAVKPVESGATIQVGDTRYTLELPAQAVETVRELKRVAELQLIHLRQIKSDKNPTGRYEMMRETGPDGHEVYKFTDTLTKKEVPTEELLKHGELIVTGRDLKPNSKQDMDPMTHGIIVRFELKGPGSSAFADFTRKNIGEYLAIVLDRKIISAPTIHSAITQGSGQIEGGFATIREARFLAQLLNAGALPVPLKEAYTSQVGATLGQDSIQRSIKAGLIGLAVVLIFMIAYYALPGLLADIALLFYAALTFAIFKGIHVVLDMPGITGFILSVGMAVDANILIFERVKEEMRSGKSLHAAIDAGFSRAFTSIFDSNMTTWIVCAVLMWLGSSLIRGFALTLGIGVAVSMFTAITVTRTMLHLVVNASWARKPALFGLNTSWLSKRFSGDRYLRVWEKRHIYWGFSLALMLVGLGCIIAGGIHPGIDFTGGTEMRVKFTQPVQESQIVQTLQSSGIKDPKAQRASDQTLHEVMLVRTEKLETAQVGQVRDVLARQGGQVLMTESIGPSIAKDVTVNAFLSVIVASLAIILYLAFRFAIGGFVNGLKYGVCAVVALLHDVITVTGFFALMGFLRGWHVDTLFVTAALTVIGFSVHDTIVVYDRIREHLRNRQRGEIFEEIANKSVTQTFDRSINTSLTVVLVLAALLIFGGSVTKLFNAALLAGIIIGTYSSVFVATPLVVLWERLTGAKVPAGARRSADVRLATAPATPRRTTPSPTPATAGVGATPRNGGSATRDTGDGDTDPGGSTRPRAGGTTIKPKRKRRM